MKDKITKTVFTDHNSFEERGEPEGNRTEVLLRACQPNAFTAKAKLAPWPPVVCFHGALRPQKWLIRDGHSLALDSALNTKNIMKPPTFRAQELCDSRGGRPGLPVPNSPY